MAKTYSEYDIPYFNLYIKQICDILDNKLYDSLSKEQVIKLYDIIIDIAQGN